MAWINILDFVSNRVVSIECPDSLNTEEQWEDHINKNHENKYKKSAMDYMVTKSVNYQTIPLLEQ